MGCLELKDKGLSLAETWIGWSEDTKSTFKSLFFHYLNPQQAQGKEPGCVTNQMWSKWIIHHSSYCKCSLFSWHFWVREHFCAVMWRVKGECTRVGCRAPVPSIPLQPCYNISVPFYERLAAGISKRFHKGPCVCRFLFQPRKDTPDCTRLINWSKSADSWLVKLCVLDWLERKPAATRPFVELVCHLWLADTWAFLTSFQPLDWPRLSIWKWYKCQSTSSPCPAISPLCWMDGPKLARKTEEKYEKALWKVKEKLMLYWSPVRWGT